MSAGDPIFDRVSSGLESADSSYREEKQELQRVLQHPEINRSASQVRFLSFICNKYFEGKSSEIREYTIAIEALGRKESSYDSDVDPIVRVTARTLRKRLAEFYENGGKDNPVQIVLPLGRYVPQFVKRSDRPGEAVLAGVLAEEDEPETPAAAEPGPFVPMEASGPASGNLTNNTPARKVAWKPVALVLVFAAIFAGGFFLGRGTKNSSLPLESASFKHGIVWGDPVWSDDFDGKAGQIPDPSKWTFDVGNQGGWGNHELETYCSPGSSGLKGCDSKRPNVFLDGNGHLILRAEKAADGSWTSGRITTRGLKSFQYGRIEARMKMPVGTGLWPSFWMLGANFATAGWPASGSFNLVENAPLNAKSDGLGPTTIRSTLHGPRYAGENGIWHDFTLPDGGRVDDGNFHSYGAIWSPGMIQFYVDDPANVFFVRDASDVPEDGVWAFDHPFLLMLNLAVGGTWPGNPDATTPSPADVVVDRVRVYKIPNIPPPTIQWQPVQLRAGSAGVSIASLHSSTGTGKVYLSCAVEPATATCGLGTSVVDFSNSLSQETAVTISTDSYTSHGHLIAAPGKYKLTLKAVTISGNPSQLTVPFVVKGE